MRHARVTRNAEPARARHVQGSVPDRAVRMGYGRAMATEQECEQALRRFATTLDGMGDGERSRHRLERTVSCHITDLGVTFSGRLKDARLLDLTTEQRPKAQLRLAMAGDDLLALVDGDLDFIPGWAAGRIKVQASMLDLVRLRSLF
jgi:hypothetical protein